MDVLKTNDLLSVGETRAFTRPRRARPWRISLAASVSPGDVIAVAEFHLRESGWTEKEVQLTRARMSARLETDLGPWAVTPAPVEIGCDDSGLFLWLWRNGRSTRVWRPDNSPF